MLGRREDRFQPLCALGAFREERMGTPIRALGRVFDVKECREVVSVLKEALWKSVLAQRARGNPV